MAQLNYYGGGSITSSDTAAASTVTLTLVGAGANNLQRISDISVYLLGAATVYTLQVTKNDGTTNIAKIGGQVNASSGVPGPMTNYTFSTPINCAVGDNAKIILTATGCTAVGLTANYTLGTK